MKTKKKTPSREYPPIYEKFVPVFLVVLAFVVIGILIATVGVVVGFVA